MRKHQGKTALILAGGGIMGAAYEIGCLSAFSRLLSPGFSTGQFDIYIGTSAGSIIATLMANQIDPAALFRSIAKNERSVFNWKRSDIYRFDVSELASSFFSTLRNLYRIYRNYRLNRWGFSLNDFFYILQEQFPAGLFSLSPMQSYLCEAFRKEGILDDFNLISRELYIPAYDLDRGKRVIFGSGEHRDMHICQAITASCAIPYFFRPHKVGNGHYVDGSTGRVTHVDIAVERGAKLVVIVNPRVPMDNDMERSCLPSLSYGRCSSIADLGINIAWEQARRIETKEKLDLAMEGYRHRFPDIDILLIEPSPEESLLFFQSPMSNTARHMVMNHGYHLTLTQLQKEYETFRQAFERHGIETTDALLNAPPPAELVL